MSRVAAIDCGTNSIRLLVMDVTGDQGVDVVRRMTIVRLGEGVDRTGRLSAEALERTRVALAGYAAEITGLGAERVRMVATSATRDAANAAAFETMVLDTLGVAPEVITGDEEARLSFAGAVYGLPPEARPPYLVVDIGGGSTEFVRGDPGGVAAARSVDIGCVRMTERHLHSDPPTPGEIAAATEDVEAAVELALATVAGTGSGAGTAAGTLIGLAGSVTTVAGIALGLDGYDPAMIHHSRVSYLDVAGITADLLAKTSAQRLTSPVMHPGRADVIGAGALVLRVIMEKTGSPWVIASERDILDGVVFSLCDPLRDQCARRTVARDCSRGSDSSRDHHQA